MDFTINENQIMRFMSTTNLMMIDWDLVLPGEELDSGHTIYKLEEAEKLIEQDVIKHPDHLWRCYETSSGGLHAFLVSHKVGPCEWARDLSLSLKGDERYVNCSMFLGVWNVRLSPKKGRRNDYVAKYYKDIGHGKYLFEHRTTTVVLDTYIGKYH